MGAWDSDPWGNDDAGDWGAGFGGDLEGDSDEDFANRTPISPEEGLEMIQEALDAVLASAEEIDAEDGSRAVAAADVVARLCGQFFARNGYTATVDKWVDAAKIEPGADLVLKAIKVVEACRDEATSELSELWEGQSDFQEALDALVERLRASGVVATKSAGKGGAGEGKAVGDKRQAPAPPDGAAAAAADDDDKRDAKRGRKT
jgi:Domain of unknown function (DUF4259)